MARINGGELLAKCLLNENIKRVFGIPGGQLTTFVDAIYRMGRPEGLDFIMTRHESAAANMADGWYRVTGEVSCCTATVGPGASNLIGGLEPAFTDNTPMLVITPQIHTNRSYPFRGSQQQMDHMGTFAPLTKWNALVNRWDRIPELVATALREATTGKTGPVHLDIPVDVLFEHHEEESIRIIPPDRYRTDARPQGDTSLVEKAAEMLVKAERPVIHVGEGVLHSEGWDELKELTEYMGAPMTNTPQSRGVISEAHPQAFGPKAPGALAADADADVVLAVGCSFGEMDFWGDPPYWGTEETQKLIHVDIDPTAIGRNRPFDIGIVGDAREVLAQLLEAVKSLTDKREPGEFLAGCKEVDEATQAAFQEMAESDAVPINPMRLVREVTEFFDEDSIFTLDGGNMALWGALAGRVYGPRQFLWAGGSGHLGVGLPMALGAKMALPDRPVYVIHGDGAFMLAIHELETAARYELPVIDIIGNDCAWGMIKGAQHLAFEERYCGVDVSPVSYDKVAESMGCFGIRVERPEEIKPALEKAVATGKPSVLDVILDSQVNLMPPIAFELIVSTWLQGCEME